MEGKRYTRNWTAGHGEKWGKWLEGVKGREAVGLEVGSFEGRSAAWFLDQVLTHPRSRLECVDPFEYQDDLRRTVRNAEGGFSLDEARRRFLENTVEYRRRGKLIHHDGRSRDVLPKLAASGRRFAFIYLDGSHYASDVLEDSVLAWLLLPRHGVLIWDDYQWTSTVRRTRPELGCPKLAVDAFLAVYAEQYERLEPFGSQAAVRKLVD